MRHIIAICFVIAGFLVSGCASQAGNLTNNMQVEKETANINESKQAEKGEEILAESMQVEKGSAYLSKTKLTLSVGKSKKLKIMGISSASKVKWKSSDKAVAKVSKKGNVRGVGAGKAKIIASVDGKEYNCIVIVKKADSGEVSKMELIMTIEGKEIPVKWEDNASVEKLRELAASGLTISMSKYGGFEQVGRIGTSITGNDKEITTKPGDIVLYSGNQMVVFYGKNTWEYTMLGHIDGYSDSELTSLLGGGDVTIVLSVK